MQRNKALYSVQRQMEILGAQSQKLKVKAEQIGRSAKRFIEVHSIKEVNENRIDYAKKWIAMVQSFIKNYEENDSNNIRKYMSYRVKRKV